MPLKNKKIFYVVSNNDDLDDYMEERSWGDRYSSEGVTKAGPYGTKLEAMKDKKQIIKDAKKYGIKVKLNDLEIEEKKL